MHYFFNPLPLICVYGVLAALPQHWPNMPGISLSAKKGLPKYTDPKYTKHNKEFRYFSNARQVLDTGLDFRFEGFGAPRLLYFHSTI
jgi:hypothetical protein